MKKITVVIAVLALLTSVNAYGFVHSFGKNRKPQMSTLRNQTRANLEKLDKGMTVEQVKQIMGNGTVKCFAGIDKVDLHLPVRVETKSVGVNTYEVYYYYTDLKAMDDKITEEETTPVVFEKGILLGKGWDFYHNLIKTNEI